MPVDPKQLARILAGAPGVPAWPECVFYLDSGDPACRPLSGLADQPPPVLYDVVNNVASATIDLTNGPTVVDSHLNFSSDVITFGSSRPSNTFNIFQGGGTLVFWVKIQSTGVVGRFVDTRGGSNSQGYYFGPRGTNPTGFQLEFVRNYTTTNGVWRVDADAFEAVVPFDQWVHIAISFIDANGASVNDPKIYINGTEGLQVIRATAPVGDVVDETNAFMRFGARATGGSNAIDGQMDVMKGWSKVLSAEEVMQDYATTRPRFQGGSYFQLLDRAIATGATASLTLTGLSSEYDGPYLVTGKVVDTFNGFFELQPVPGIALSSCASSFDYGVPGTPAIFTSSSGWLVAGRLSGGSDYVTFFTAWIWPNMGHGGATSGNAQARMCRSIGTALDNGTIYNQEGWGEWNDTNNDAPFESITLFGVGGSTMEQGSEVSIYKLGYGADPA